jgi:hypothetical protein
MTPVSTRGIETIDLEEDFSLSLMCLVASLLCFLLKPALQSVASVEYAQNRKRD